MMTRAVAAMFALIALAGCDKLSSDGRSNAVSRAEAEVRLDDPEAMAETADATAPAPMSWTVHHDPESPAASYGASGAQPVFALRCDRAAGQIALIRGGGAPGGLGIAVDGADKRYETRPLRGDVTGFEARTPLDDPWLDRMSAGGARLTLSANDGQPIDIIGGPAIRRVVSACRAPKVEPIDGATFTGALPCADCPGIDVTLTFQDAVQPGRYRLVFRYRERGTITTEGNATAAPPDVGPVYRLAPDKGGEISWIEQVRPDIIVFRTPDNFRSDAMARYPLTRTQGQVQ